MKIEEVKELEEGMIGENGELFDITLMGISDEDPRKAKYLKAIRNLKDRDPAAYHKAISLN